MSNDERDSDILEQAHNEGQADGSSDTSAFHEFMTSVHYDIVHGEEASEAYEKGLENGRNNPSGDD